MPLRLYGLEWTYAFALWPLSALKETKNKMFLFYQDRQALAHKIYEIESQFPYPLRMDEHGLLNGLAPFLDPLPLFYSDRGYGVNERFHNLLLFAVYADGETAYAGNLL